MTEIRRIPLPPRTPDWFDAPVHRMVTSDDLLAGERVVIIRHGAEEYRLRLTASGKLLLTR